MATISAMDETKLTELSNGLEAYLNENPQIGKADRQRFIGCILALRKKALEVGIERLRAPVAEPDPQPVQEEAPA